jgi:hypothetical protein
MEVERMEVEHMEVERTKVVGTDLQSHSLCLEVEHMEVEHMEVVGMSMDRTDNDMAVEVPSEPEVQQGGRLRRRIDIEAAMHQRRLILGRCL